MYIKVSSCNIYFKLLLNFVRYNQESGEPMLTERHTGNRVPFTTYKKICDSKFYFIIIATVQSDRLKCILH